MNKHADKTPPLRNCYSKTSHPQSTDISPSITTRKVEWQEASNYLYVHKRNSLQTGRENWNFGSNWRVPTPTSPRGMFRWAVKLRALWSETHVLARPFRSNYTVNLVVRNKRWIHSSKCVIVKELRIVRGYTLSQRCKLSLHIYELQRSAYW